MAKRKGQDNFLLYIIIGFVVLIVGLSAALIITNTIEDNNTTTYEYDEFEHLYDFSQFDSQNESLYGVYYYQETCGGCQAAKQDTLAFATENNLNMNVYLVDANLTSDNDNVKDDIVFNGEELRYTPTLLIYNDGVLEDMIVGYEALISFYNTVENGNY